MVGKIYFLLVRIKIKHMEIAIIKKETSGTRTSTPSHPHTLTPSHHHPLTAPNIYTENDQVAKYEIMDGAPVRGTVPFPLLHYSMPVVQLFRVSIPHSYLSCFSCVISTSPFRSRRVHSHSPVPVRLRPDPHHARHQQEVQRSLLP